MLGTKRKYAPLPSASSIEQLPIKKTRDDFTLNFESHQAKVSRWNSKTPQSFSSPTYARRELPVFNFPDNKNYNLTMNHGSSLFLEEGDMINSILDTGVSSYRFPNEKCANSFSMISTRFKVHDKFQAICRPYDKEMLSKLDFKRESNHKPSPSSLNRSILPSTTLDTSSTFSLSYGKQVPSESLSLPVTSTRKIPPIDSFLHWAEAIPFPSTCNHTISQADSKFPTEINNNIDRSFLPRFPSHLANIIQDKIDRCDPSLGNRNPLSQRIFMESEEENRKERNIIRRSLNEKAYQSDLYPPLLAVGKKRRASSPLDDENTQFYAVKSPNKFSRKYESVTPRNPSDSRYGSISSINSDIRSDSHSSTESTTSSRTSVSSFGRLSPGGISPKSIDVINSSHTTSNQRHRRSSFKVNLQQKSSNDNKMVAKTTHQRLESVCSSQQNQRLSNSVGIFICECCPKKPKKFDNKEDLDAHEQEKQYECAFCRNRFKNKNEAERHQNSLHLRRHSWSCTALSGYAAAFYNSSLRPGEADTCGFCGEDFPRSRMDSGIFVITKQDWDYRINHLTEIHKFGECNHDKKFFRADHFRQHLKHSHAGTSGKWTNMLENACMKDEPVRNPIGSPENINPGGSQISSCDLVNVIEL
ncbi:putative c2h2 finger domain-containing protein [Erysiphe necator]|uniref:Putative c2h2 finger domain-containing protein n=1 Tax=Uncinula necator TaxID=52586 RepID=A0A0B1P8N5_UNCNE|nr:putative c2h2 finger domain-containing protein [Erysiphe necator]